MSEEGELSREERKKRGRWRRREKGDSPQYADIH